MHCLLFLIDKIKQLFFIRNVHSNILFFYMFKQKIFFQIFMILF